MNKTLINSPVIPLNLHFTFLNQIVRNRVIKRAHVIGVVQHHVYLSLKNDNILKKLNIWKTKITLINVLKSRNFLKNTLFLKLTIAIYKK